MKIKVLDIKGKNIETIDLAVKKEGSMESALRYIRVFLSNQRQGTSSTKTRREVSGGGKKPWKQKGTGRARAGSIRSPLWVGGGISHGPKPKSWKLQLTKNIKLGSWAFALNNLANNDSLVAVDFSSINKPSSKIAQEFVKETKFDPEKLLIVHQNNDIVFRSFRNIKNAKVMDFKSVSTFDLLSASKVIVDKESIDSLKEKLK